MEDSPKSLGIGPIVDVRFGVGFGVGAGTGAGAGVDSGLRAGAGSFLGFGAGAGSVSGADVDSGCCLSASRVSAGSLSASGAEFTLFFLPQLPVT